MKKVIMLAVFTVGAFALEMSNAQRNEKTQDAIQQPKKAAIKEDQQKMIPIKVYPMKKKEYSRGTIATH